MKGNKESFEEKFGRPAPKPEDPIIFHCLKGGRALKAWEASTSIGFTKYALCFYLFSNTHFIKNVYFKIIVPTNWATNNKETFFLVLSITQEVIQNGQVKIKKKNQEEILELDYIQL